MSPIEAEEVRIPRFVSVGECIVEFSGELDKEYHLSFEGRAFKVAQLARRQLGADWSVDLLTALGDDHYSQRIVDDLVADGIGIAHVIKIAGRAVGLRVVEAASGDTAIANWRSQSAARLIAEDPRTLEIALQGAHLVYVTGSIFGVLAPRARGRLLRSLHRARQAGSRIVLAPYEWPEVWTSRRVMGSAINAISMVAGAIFTSKADEGLVFAETDADAIARRYHEWGVDDVFVWDGPQAIYHSSPASGRWIEEHSPSGGDPAHASILAALARELSPLPAIGSTQHSGSDGQ